jgi:glyoxylase-like metal-dependent hydrolase (beta-lactamase superfamily II)
MHKLIHIMLWLVFVLVSIPYKTAIAAEGLEVQKVADNVYALVGPLGGREPANLANNATYGVVITSEGVILINSGGTYRGARQIRDVIKTITVKPVKIVINTDAQYHSWFGNGYFRSQGAKIIAHRKTVEDQKARRNDQLLILERDLGEAAMEGTQAAYADEMFDDKLTITLGDRTLELYSVGPAHTPADAFVWLPAEKLVFAGHIVYVERMLSVRSYSHSGSWIKAFETVAGFEPIQIVPAHGHSTTLETARKDTYGYLQFLRKAVADFMDAGSDIADIGQIDQSAYSYLVNYDALRGRNAQQVYQELEWE